MYVFVYVCMHMYMCWAEIRLGVCLYCIPLYVLRQGLSLKPGPWIISTDWTRCTRDLVPALLPALGLQMCGPPHLAHISLNSSMAKMKVQSKVE